jgi:integrative and conjugative element protein (TIGR02256 family)
MTEGQEWALSQLREIASNERALEIIEVSPPNAEGGTLSVEISVDCTLYQYLDGGLPLRGRERFAVEIPSTFPLSPPDVRTLHTRFAEFPHVQWGRKLCIYQASDVEWSPEDGIIGFLERLDDWLRLGAQGQLDPIGLPLHPPAVYTTRWQLIVPRVNTPPVTGSFWAGYAEIDNETDGAVILGQWHEYRADAPEVRLAGAILLPGTMPHEYPTSVRQLEAILSQRLGSAEILRILLTLTALRNPNPDKGLFFVLGAAMRGTSGDVERLQHLACWYIEPAQGVQLRQIVMAAEEERRVVAQAEFEVWAETAKIDWSPVRDERPEIVVPRDAGSPASWWRNKRVAILGCGALGSSMAMMAVRAGAAAITLIDKAAVTPGVLARQLFNRNQIGFQKTGTTRTNLLAINPDVQIVSKHKDVLTILRENANVIFDVDVVINATASTSVAAALEKHFVDPNRDHPPIVSVAIGHRAEFGMVTLGLTGFAGVTTDLDRRTKISLANHVVGQEFLEEFWPSRHRKIFQPEPGCSEPTFIGSAADVLGFSATLFNIAAGWLVRDDRHMARACVLRALHLATRQKPPLLEFSWQSDRITPDGRHGYQIRISCEAEREIVGWISASERKRSRDVETGGLLFGHIDEFLKVAWVTEVSGPPPDSIASEAGFLCGTAGTRELNQEKQERSRGSTRFIGMWHTHPGARAQPSDTDFGAMKRLWEVPEKLPRKFLMLIVGGRAPGQEFGGHIFDRTDRLD